jgi:hypothetical protein
MNTTDIIAAINSGSLDSDLGQLNTALAGRLTAVRALKKNTDFGLGDKVKFNEHCGTRYLIGHTATVVGRKKVKLIVKLDAPTGRFARVLPNGQVESASVTVPITIVDPA